jgi:hypothetical protein
MFMNAVDGYSDVQFSMEVFWASTLRSFVAVFDPFHLIKPWSLTFDGSKVKDLSPVLFRAVTVLPLSVAIYLVPVVYQQGGRPKP